MEHYVAESRRPISRCLNDVRIADAYIGIFGFRYGYIPEGKACSVTELEFRQAVDYRKDTFLFLLAENTLKHSATETRANKRKIESLRAELKSDFLVSYFSAPDQLEALVTAAIANWSAPRRTPPDQEREIRLLRSWLNSRSGMEKARSRQALVNMASKAYVAVASQKLLNEEGSPEELFDILGDVVRLSGHTDASSSLILQILEESRPDLRAMVVFHLGDWALMGHSLRATVIDLLPKIASDGDIRVRHELIHTLEKMIRAEAFSGLDEVSVAKVNESIEILRSADEEEIRNRAEAVVAVCDQLPSITMANGSMLAGWSSIRSRLPVRWSTYRGNPEFSPDQKDVSPSPVDKRRSAKKDFWGREFHPGD
jgi:hypothetical protein